MDYETRVKSILAASIEDLVQRKNIADISVKDIVSNWDVSRATFYRYFKDKYELMNWVFQKELNELLEEYPHLSQWKEVTLVSIQIIYKNKKYYENIARYKNQNSVIEHVSERTHFYFISRLEEKFGKDKVSKSLRKSVEFYCAGITYLLLDWIERGMKESPEILTNWLCDFIPEPLLKAIE